MQQPAEAHQHRLKPPLSGRHLRLQLQQTLTQQVQYREPLSPAAGVAAPWLLEASLSPQPWAWPQQPLGRPGPPETRTVVR